MIYWSIGVLVAAGLLAVIARRAQASRARSEIDVGSISEGWLADQRGTHDSGQT
jgi:hypothetical protein